MVIADIRSAYQQVLSLMQTVSDLNAAVSVLGWDQETYMPPAAIEARAEQVATLSRIAHEHMVSDTAQRLAEHFQSVLPSLNGELSESEKRIVDVFIRDVQRAARLPDEFVQRRAWLTTLAQEAWKEARERSSFSIFRDHLVRVVELMREQAEYLGYRHHPYDALLDLYDPGITVAVLDPIFERLQQATHEILEYVLAHTGIQDDPILRGHFPAEQQLALAQRIISAMGFDFRAGRVDLSAHPFCTSFAISDVRLTTRINEQDLRSCLFGLIHEAGHGLYEQGVSAELGRTFAQGGTSMGIHESQSLFWENVIARSEEFWQWALPILAEQFPSAFATITPHQMYRAINRVRASLIRIDSDEVTYNMHIILRYKLEKGLIEGTIDCDSVPQLWNELMKELLHVDVPDDAHGCLQDIHWSFGGIGYFPSYTLGKLYAAMFRTALLESIPEAPEYIRRGDLAPIRQWLKEHIHKWGRLYQPQELVARVTGRTLTEQDFIEYAWAKVRRVYHMS